MCGIAGLVHRGGFSTERRPTDIARDMGATLQHRGPDDCGVWGDDQAGVALAHQRLSIIDLSPGGHQPMTSACGRYVIVYNGEVYNFAELRRSLEGEGHAFRSDSDTEVVLEACAAWGIERAVARFVGMFAFALWDTRDRRLTLVRDRLGIKPLYWGEFGGAFVFASELKALRPHPGFKPDIDRGALASYVRHACVPGPGSIFRNVHKLQPGHILVVEDGGAPKIEAFWDVRDFARGQGWDGGDEGDDDEAQERFEALLTDAVRLRMISDAPVGAFLSGGIDSSVVVALMQTLNAQPVKTFTVGFDEAGYDEASDAAAVARHLGTDHHAIRVTPDEARDVIPKLATIYDEPFADSSQIPTYLISKFARQNVTVCLSGDGGDELLAGYNRHVWAARRSQAMANVPRALRRLAATGLKSVSPSTWDRVSSVLPAGKRPKQFGDKLHKLAGVLPLDDVSDQYARLVSHWADPEGVVLGAPGAGSSWGNHGLDAMSGLSSMADMQLRDTIGYLPDDILTKVDRATMAVSLEARVPLLDHRLVEFAWSLPDRFKCRDGAGKWLLRRVLARHVPRDMFERPKSGFAIPVGAWLRGPLKDWAAELLSEQRLREEGYFDPAPIRKMWQEHQAGARNADAALWSILMFQSWLETNAKDTV